MSRKWLVEIIRFSAFPKTPIVEIDQTWWTWFTGKEPATKTHNLKNNFVREEGEHVAGRLVVNVTPIRLDCYYTTPEYSIEEDTSEDIPNIGISDDVYTTFRETVSRFIENRKLPDLQRIAFGTILLQPVPDLRDGYIALTEYLPDVKIDVEDSSDLLYQINRRRLIRVEDREVSINRLSKWSVRITEGVAFQIKPDVKVIPSHSKATAIHLELDINTIPAENYIFSNKETQQVFYKLAENAVEIEERGDIK